MFKYETHMHTSPVSWCAKNTPAEHVRAYSSKGYTGVIVTDHFVIEDLSDANRHGWETRVRFLYSGYESAKLEGDKCGLDVFFGWEICLDGRDFLTYGLNLDFLLKHNDLDLLTVKEYSNLVRTNGGVIVEAHPFRYERQTMPAPDTIDAVEVYNAAMPSAVNKKAFEYAKLHNLTMLSGSDSHSVDLSFASGILLKKKVVSIDCFVKEIVSGQASLVLP